MKRSGADDRRRGYRRRRDGRLIRPSVCRIAKSHSHLRGPTAARPARRHGGGARREWPSPMLPALQALPSDGADVHVVASGDPLLHGVGGTLIRLFGAEKVKVLPHVSAVTLACARIGWNGAGHGGGQPGHRAAAHRGAPRRSGDRVVQRPRHARGAGSAARRRTAAAIPSSPCSNSSAAPTNAAATAPPRAGPPARRSTSTTST